MSGFKDNLDKYAGGVIVPLVVLGMGLAAYFLILPKYKDVQAARLIVTDKKAVVANRQEMLKNIKALVAEYQAKKQKLQPIDESLPTAARIPELLANLEQIAKQSGIQIAALDITPAPTIANVASGQSAGAVKKTEELLGNTENLSVMDVNIVLVGTYPNLKAWLKNAEQNLRLMDARVIVADEVDNQNGSQEFNLKINAYYEKDEK